MLDEAIKRKWIKALRSGKFKKTTFQFTKTQVRDGSTQVLYCALGVLNKIQKKSQCHHSIRTLGLNQLTTDKIIKLNDVDKRSFKQIANFIEKNKLI